jgi:pyruvate/2-oxoglutarate/acetoin dehydrogenase E1 component
VEQHIAEPGELDQVERNASKVVENMRMKAWKAFSLPIFRERQKVADLIAQMERGSSVSMELAEVRQTLMAKATPFRKDILAAVHQALLLAKDEPSGARESLINWRKEQTAINEQRFGSHLYSQSENSALRVKAVQPICADEAEEVPGFQVLNAAFEAMLARDPRVIAFGEDVGMLGGVNQTWAGLQEKFGSSRVTDTGIREATILGQAIGMAVRGLRPIAEVQYLDYLLYALQTMADDLATLHWRTAGGQKAPVIVSTRGHRLEGVWHAGSPMSSIVNLVRGMHVLVPRDMTRAAGFYNTLLLGDEPGLVVEVLNGYRLKEKMPDNIGEITVPLGVPEILRPGEDVTIVTYGAACRIAMKAAEMLQQVNIDVEVIDAQSLLPFDRHGHILESLKKTSRIVFMDEDVPGGATAYMLQQVIEKQGGFYWLDSEPRTVSAKAHRPAFGSDGGYFSKPNADDLFDAVYELMNEVSPANYPLFYK